MQLIIDWAKNRWHRDIVSHPVIHGWVLNLYRAGERYPQTVCDYFPWTFAPNEEIASLLRRHARDEERHTAMYTHAIHAMEQPVMEMDDPDVFNFVIRRFTTESFTIVASDDAESRRVKLAHFFAHAHFLEKRIARSLEYHLDACTRGGAADAERVVSAVLADERRHVEYTASVARELLARDEAARTFEHHRRAEAIANLQFSQRQVRTFTRRYAALMPLNRVPLYRACAFLMEQAAAHV
jgi:rubrerythrin